MSEEPKIISTLVNLCKEMNIKCAVQIGAADGHEVECIRHGVGCRAVAIDGDSRSTPCSTNIEYYHNVIGATDCQVKFFINNNKELSTQIRRNEKDELGVTLPQMRLDTFCNKHGIVPDALFIDTEGTTLDVLEGCGDLLKNVRLIYAECQTVELRGGMRLLEKVDEFLLPIGFVRREGLPAYSCGAQGNYTWIKK